MSKFKKGDKLIAYYGVAKYIGICTGPCKLGPGLLWIHLLDGSENSIVSHYKACRKLKKKKRR